MAWKVVLYCSNRASICSHALILLSPTRWFVMTGWRTSISLQPFVQLQPFDQTRLDCGSFFVYKHRSPALCFKHVWFMAPCLVYKHLPTCFLCFKHVWIIGSLSTFTSTSLEPKWLPLTLITQCKCLVLHVVGIPVMCTRTVA